MKKFIILFSVFTATLLSSQTITTIAGSSVAAYGGDNGSAISASISANESQLALDNAGNIYIADYANHRVRKITKSTGIITTIAGTGVAGFSGDGGQATSAELHYPYGVCIDNTGNIYISDYFNSRIRKINTSGIITTIAGNGTFSTTGNGGPAIAASINAPGFIDVDNANNLYFTEFSGHVVRKISSAGIISTIAGTGTTGINSGNGGSATLAVTAEPWALCVNKSNGDVYFASYSFNNNGSQVRLISGSTITAFAGTGAAGYSGDGGLATNAMINSPQGIAYINGEVYISDFNNYRIRKVSSSGIITTAVGTGTQGFNGDGGLPLMADINNPTGIVGNSCFNYFIDNGSRIRQINFTPNVTATSSQTSTICAGQSVSLNASGASTYTWSTTSNNTLIVVSPSVTTTYTVTGTNMGCSVSATVSQSVSACTGIAINVSNKNTEVKLFPNPTNGILNIELGNIENTSLVITNALGQVVLTEKVTNELSSLNIQGLSNGIYFVQVVNNNKVVNTQKIIKQ